MCVLFFASGFAALVYQVVWQRMLALFSGTDVYSVTIIVAAYMGGLGCGSLAGGYLADRLDPRLPILCYGVAELLVASFALASKWLYYDLLYNGLGPRSFPLGVLTPLLFTSLLLPTFCMGLTLPLLSRALTRSIKDAPGRIAMLYGLNTLGAALGALATTWSLVARFGLEGSLALGAALNFACGASVLVLFRPLARHGGSGTPSGSTEVRSPPVSPTEQGISTWPLVYALSGFIALSCEIVWFRVLGVMLKSTAFTFGTLLGIYLAGLGAGSILGVPLARRLRRQASAFFALQAGITIFACGSLALFVIGLERGFLPSIAGYFARYEPLGVGTALRGLYQMLSGPARASDPTRELVKLFLSLYVVLPASLIGPPTFLMGLSFPLLQKVVQNDALVLGRRVGTLQAANIGGATLGALLVGFVSLRVLGTSGTLKLLGALGSCFLFLGYRSEKANRPFRRLEYAAALVLLGCATLAVPGTSRLWARLHGTEVYRARAEEDETGINVIVGGSGARTTVFTGGIGQSWLPYGSSHSWLGFLPVMLHPHPMQIAIIGLGSGDTVFSSGGRAETSSILCVELVRAQLSSLRSLAAERDFGGLRSVLEDPRVRFAFADGRAFIRQRKETYDVIESDALRPHSAFAGNLYSLEYFSMIRDSLKRGGYAVTWAPTGRTIRTFVKVFPHVLVFDVENVAIAVGSDEPIQWDRLAVRERLLAPSAQEYYAREDIDLQALAERIDHLPPPRIFGPEYDREGIVDFNSDLFPRDEFLASGADAKDRAEAR